MLLTMNAGARSVIATHDTKIAYKCELNLRGKGPLALLDITKIYYWTTTFGAKDENDNFTFIFLHDW